MRKKFFKIKHWWRKQDLIFKMDFKFQAVVLFIGIILCVFGNPALLFIIIPLITHTSLYSDIFRIEKYTFIKIIKRHKDYIHILKEINKSNNRLIDNLEGQLKIQTKILNSTYVYVSTDRISEIDYFMKRFDDCFMVGSGCMVPYDIYVEILTNSDRNEKLED